MGTESRRVPLLLSAVTALSLMVAILGPTTASAGPTAQDSVSIWRVAVSSKAEVDALVNGGYDLVESRGPNYLLVVGEPAVAADLRGKGFTVTLDRTLSPLAGVSRVAGADGTLDNQAALYFGGYRTVDEHYAHLDTVAATYPGLATIHDYGDSWRKVNGRPNPNELKVICLTAKQAGDCALNPNSTKPRALVMAAIHARELQTAELAWRLIDELTQRYATDADIRHLLDTTEVWVIPVANPDGREIVESGGNSPYLQRKNANDTLGNCSVPPTSSNQHGVDLNRNASVYNYGGVGTTTSACAATYRGTGPASEPEQAALEALFRNVWPDQKGAPTAAVPATARGTFVTLHSYGNLVLLPPGAGGTTPNDTELRKLAFRMSHYNGYQTGTGPEILYGTTGATDDWVHYTLGVAGFTYEVSPSSGSCSGFTPAYSCIDSSLWPLNRDALLYAVKAAGAPYVTPQGPTVTGVSVPGTVAQGAPAGVSATVNDNAYGTTGVSRPTARTVTQAEYYLDTPPSAGGTPLAMSSADGAFDETNESASASIGTGSLTPGQHTVYVRSRNAAGFWGPVTAAAFTVTSGGGTGVVFQDGFETDQGWTVNPSGTDAATLGIWGASVPQQTTSSGVVMQPGVAAGGTRALVTDGRAGSSAGAFDVDGGVTSIRSPAIALPTGASLTISLRYYLAHLANSSGADFLRVSVVGPGGSTVLLQETGAAENDAASWAAFNGSLTPYAGQTVRLLVESSDAPTASLVEAGIDELVIEAS